MSQRKLKGTAKPVATQRMSPEEQQVWQDNILDRYIKPNVLRLAEISVERQVAVVVVEPSGKTTLGALRTMGWDGKSVVFAMEPVAAEEMATNCARMGDNVTASWLRRGSEGRLFLAVNEGTLLLNFEPGRGYYTEPGSTNGGLMN